MAYLILSFHVFVIGGLTLFFLRLGKEALIAWLALLAVAMNLFVLKQISLFGLTVTASDPLSVGYLLAFNLIQEFFGKKFARKAMWIAFAISLCFLILSQFQLAYQPSAVDHSHVHYVALLSAFPRLVIASLTTFFCVQFFDLTFFSYIRSKTHGRWLTARVALSLCLAQTLDTILFSFLGLYGIVDSILQIIVFCLSLKLMVVIFSSPFAWVSKKVATYEI